MKKKVPIEKIILTLIAVTGVLAIIAIAPGIGPALQLFTGKKTYREYEINRALKRMEYKGYVEYILRDGKKFARLTKKGRFRLSQYDLQGAVSDLHKKRKKDGKWHIIIFDIKEKRRVMRNKMRRQLVAAGFVRLQNSVWVSQYNAEEFVALLKMDNHIGKDVVYIRADYIENEKVLKKKFNIT